MKSNNRIGRRDFLRYTAGGSALALAGSWSRGSDAQAANALTIGVLRAPAAAIVDLSQHHGWFKEAGVELKTELFASAAGPKIVLALGGGAVDVSFVNTTAALLGMAGGAIP
jgi:ABC-type nitrate/sulfonate/bicarbonate transport system substrate-binding protein